MDFYMINMRGIRFQSILVIPKLFHKESRRNSAAFLLCIQQVLHPILIFSAFLLPFLKRLLQPFPAGETERQSTFLL